MRDSLLKYRRKGRKSVLPSDRKARVRLTLVACFYSLSFLYKILKRDANFTDSSKKKPCAPLGIIDCRLPAFPSLSLSRCAHIYIYIYSPCMFQTAAPLCTSFAPCIAELVGLPRSRPHVRLASLRRVFWWNKNALGLHI